MTEEARLWASLVFACLALGILLIPESWMEWSDRVLGPWIKFILGALVFALALNLVFGYLP